MELFCVNNIRKMISEEKKLNNKGLYSYVSSIKLINEGKEENIKIIEIDNINSENKINKYRHCTKTELMLPLLKNMKNDIFFNEIKYKFKEFFLLCFYLCIIIKYSLLSFLK